MNRRLFTAALSAALLFSGVSAFAQSSSWVIDKNHSQVNFQVRHMGVSNVRGSISGVTGTVVWDEKDPSKSSVEATMDATTVSTNNDARDKHLKSPDFFNVEKFSTLTFKSTAVTGTNGKLQVIGDLTIHGTTREVTLDGDPLTPEISDPWGNARRGFSATTSINRKDFNLTYNNLLKSGEAVVGDTVKIQVDAELVKKK